MQVIEDPTVAEIASKSLAAVRVFETLGIDYCCGDKRPLAEVCRTKGLDVDAVQRQLDEAAMASPQSARDWTVEPLRDLIDHIVNTHHAYLNRELPAIGMRAVKVYRVYNQRYGPTLTGLPDVFDRLRSELEMHMRKDEMVLFPAIVACEAAINAGDPPPQCPIGPLANPIAMMEAEHESAGEALVKIRDITQNFFVPDYACVTYRAMISGLRELEEDLHMHVHLENNVLFPRAMQIERRRD
jgi:regulator of cell morphogenesis and NO signaling